MDDLSKYPPLEQRARKVFREEVERPGGLEHVATRAMLTFAKEETERSKLFQMREHVKIEDLERIMKEELGAEIFTGGSRSRITGIGSASEKIMAYLFDSMYFH